MKNYEYLKSKEILYKLVFISNTMHIYITSSINFTIRALNSPSISLKSINIYSYITFIFRSFIKSSTKDVSFFS